MMTLRALIACLFAVVLLTTAGRSVAQTPGEIPDELDGVGIEEHLGETVSSDIAFVDSEGNAVTLGDYFDGERPVAVAFVYHNCPMLCSLILDGMTTAMREAGLDLGDDYQALAISFDPRDTPERAAEVRERYLARFDGAQAAEGLYFLTGSQESIDRITDEIGFGFEWNERQQEFAHTAAVYFISPEGVITRYLYGLEFHPRDFRTAVLEAGSGTIASPLDQLILYCFQYDPDAGSYVLHATNAMKVGGVLTLILLGGFLLFFWRRESTRLDAADPTLTPS
ncbi:MAG: SCO family protein [Rhodothermales bacterium]